MATPKLTGFIIGSILISLFAVAIMYFQSDMNFYYNNQNFNSSDLESFNKLNEFKVQTETIKNQTENIKTKTGILDIIGSYIENGYQAALLSLKSFNIFSDMADTFFTKIGIGSFGSYLKVALISIVIVLLFVGILVSALIKREM